MRDEYTASWSSSIAPTTTQCQREGVVDFAELLLRCYELLAQRAAARALPGALPAHPGRRVPGHQRLQYRWLKLLAGRERAPDQRERDLRGRRRRPVDLSLSRRQRRQHGRLRARVSRPERHQAGAELPLARPHPRCRQRADPATTSAGWARSCGPTPVEGEPVRIFEADWPTVRGGAMAARGGQRLIAEGMATPRDRRALPLERAVARDRACAVLRRHSLPRLRRPALLRARRDQARARLPAADREPDRRHCVPAQSSTSRRAASGRARSSSCRTRAARGIELIAAVPKLSGKAVRRLESFVALSTGCGARSGNCRSMSGQVVVELSG